MLSRLLLLRHASSCAAAARNPLHHHPRLAASAQLLHATSPRSAEDDTPPAGTSSPSPAGSEGAAPGHDSGHDSDVKGAGNAWELYGRPDRDPTPSPNPGLTQATAPDMSFPRDEPSRGDSSSSASGAPAAKEEGLKSARAYPIQNDPSVPDGAGPELSPEVAQELQQDEGSGPKAAGQGVVEELGRKQ